MIDMGKLTSSIMAHEGLRLQPYTDTTGNITIGYGRNLTGKGISHDEAASLLSNDIENALAQAQGEPWWSHVAGNDARARALVEIVFNIGLGGLRPFTHAIASLCNDDFAGAAQAFLDSQWAKQVGQRATILTQMIYYGEDT